MSFLEDKIQTEGLTFDDVLLIPAYSEVLPREVSIASRFSRNVQINTPIASAAMDTVTEAEMAIAIARAGGIGVIHKNMTIAEQAAQVRKVKRAENGMIYDPVTIGKDNTVGDALQLMKENRIGGIPVVTPEGVLIGIVTNRDLRFQRDMSRRIEEVMTKENLITTHNPDLQTASDILLQNKIEKLPVVDAGGRLIGLLTYKDITKVQANPNAAKDDKGRLRVAAGVGVTYNTMERVGALAEAQADVIVIDTAHGHSKGVIDMLRRVKKEYPDLEAQGIMLPVIDVQSRYVSPAFDDDLLTVRVTLAEMPKVKMRFDYEVFRENGERINTGSVTLAFMNAATKRACRAPGSFLERLKPYF